MPVSHDLHVLQHDDLIAETMGGDFVCAECGEPLEPLYENNGFNEPGAEHVEFIGYKYCLHKGVEE